MKKQNNAWLISLIVLFMWVVFVLGGEILAAGGDPTGLDALVQGQVVPVLVIAPILLLVVVINFKRAWLS